jgi:hypothetical protein
MFKSALKYISNNSFQPMYVLYKSNRKVHCISISIRGMARLTRNGAPEAFGMYNKCTPTPDPNAPDPNAPDPNAPDPNAHPSQNVF